MLADEVQRVLFSTRTFSAGDKSVLSYNVFPSTKPRAGQVVVLNANGFCGMCYLHLVAYLVREFEVYTLDLRGHGSNCSVAAPGLVRVEDVLEFVDAERLHRPWVFGHSIGGTVALAAELLRPGLWQEMYLWEPILHVEETAASIMDFCAALAQRARKRTPWFPDRSSALERMSRGLPFLSPPSLLAYVDHALQPSGGGLAVRCGIEADCYFRAIELAKHNTKHLHLLRTRMTVAAGSKTHPALLHSAKLLTERTRDAAMHVVRGAGHLGPLSHPGVVAHAFVSAVDAAEEGCRPPAACFDVDHEPDSDSRPQSKL